MRRTLIVTLVVIALLAIGSFLALAGPAVADTQGPGVRHAAVADWPGGGGGTASPVPGGGFGGTASPVPGGFPTPRAALR